LIDKLGVVDEGVAVVLPVHVDFVVAVHLDLRDGVFLMPVAHVGFHSWGHIPLVVARTLAASPVFPVSDREVEVCTSEISSECGGNLKAVAHAWVSYTLSNFGVISTNIRGRLLNVAERKVAAESIDFTIRRPKLEKVSLGTISLVKSTEPGLRPRVLSVKAITFVPVVTALASTRLGDILGGGPTESTINIRDHAQIVRVAGVALKVLVNGCKSLPGSVVGNDSLFGDEGLKLSLHGIVGSTHVNPSVVVSLHLDDVSGVEGGVHHHVLNKLHTSNHIF